MPKIVAFTVRDPATGRFGGVDLITERGRFIKVRPRSEPTDPLPVSGVIVSTTEKDGAAITVDHLSYGAVKALRDALTRMLDQELSDCHVLLEQAGGDPHGIKRSQAT